MPSANSIRLAISLLLCQQAAHAFEEIMIVKPKDEKLARIEQHRLTQECLREINREVNVVKRVCRLDEKQVRKLRVAAKGTAAKVAEERMRQRQESKIIVRQIGRRRLPLKKVDIKQQSAVEHPMWTRLFRKVLTADQRKAYSNHKFCEQFMRHRTASDRYVEQIDRFLQFTGTQRSELLELVDSTIGAQLFQQAVESRSPNRNRRTGAPLHHLLPKDELQQILSDDQIAKWKTAANKLPRVFSLDVESIVAKLPERPLPGALFVFQDHHVVVKATLPNSPADKILQPGDVILEIQDQKINNISDIVAELDGSKVGQSVTMTILRDDQESQVTTKLMMRRFWPVRK